MTVRNMKVEGVQTSKRPAAELPKPGIVAQATKNGTKRAKIAATGSDSLNEWNGVLNQCLISACYSESIIAKIWRVANRALLQIEPPKLYPEYTGEDGATYVYRDLDFWTSGFFPGSLYLLLERQMRYPKFFPANCTRGPTKVPHQLQLQHLCRWWTYNLHGNAQKRDTHDVGFMVGPWATKAWELQRDPQAFHSIVTAANSLASRFDRKVQAIRSWDVCVTKRYTYTNPSADFLVIIDNMLNIDVLFWAAKETGNRELYDIAVAHARTTQKDHIRSDHTTFHVVNYDAQSGEPKEKFTNQGYSDESCWSRGQAWGILGFSQTFNWTGEVTFLKTACSLADYFICHIPEDGVPYWDFTAPITATSPRDTSAAMIATCGLLSLYKALANNRSDGQNQNQAIVYLDAAMRILRGTVNKHLNPPTFRFCASKAEHEPQPIIFNGSTTERAEHQPILTVDDSLDTHGSASNQPLHANSAKVHSKGSAGSNDTPIDTILGGATINNYEHAPRRWANHGLVYADYYFILAGNILLEMGLVDQMAGALDF